MTKFYRFDFDKGVPVKGGQMRWRKGVTTLPAYSLQDAINKFAMPVLKQYGTNAKLNVVSAFVSDDKKDWRQLTLDEVVITAFFAGCVERMKLEERICKACECPIDKDGGCGCNPHDA